MSLSAQITCPECSSSIEVYLNNDSSHAKCTVCSHEVEIHLTDEHRSDKLNSCVVCQRRAFYKQKDFNRIVGVTLFIIAAILSIWTYGLSFVVLWLLDMFLFKKLSLIAICYKCTTIYRGAANIGEIGEFDHQLHDRIVYSDYDPDANEPSSDVST